MSSPDTTAPVLDASPQPAAPAFRGRRGLRALVLLAVFICAACGLVYELALITLGAYLLGSSITQTSLVIAVSMFAMGAGAVLAKPLLSRPLRAFIGIELALAVVGGLSVPLLYGAFAWVDVYTVPMLLTAFVIGALVGAEIPLLMALLQRLRSEEAARAIADINAVDYAGALVGGLLFPFLLLPRFGLLEGTLVVAGANVLAAWVVAWAFTRRAEHRQLRIRATALCAVLIAGLVLVGVKAAEFEATAQQRLYRGLIVHSERSEYQSLVVTRGALAGSQRDDVRLFLDGDLQFSSVDEYRYHEMLVHPALSGERERVLVLGGGDGLALREILKYPDVEEVTLVDLDPAVVDLAREFEPIAELNEHAWDDDRVTHLAQDAFTWVRAQSGSEPWDAIVVDFPDPDATGLAKLYSAEFYAMLSRLLAPHGSMVVQGGSPFFAADAFWCVEQTVASAGLRTTAYHADVPSFGNWGFVHATHDGAALSLSPDAPQMRYASREVLAAASVFPPDRARREVQTSTLLDPSILTYSTQGWKGY